MSGLFNGEQIATGSIPIDKLGTNNFVTTDGDSTIDGSLIVNADLSIGENLLPLSATSNIGSTENMWNNIYATDLQIQSMSIGTINLPTGTTDPIAINGGISVNDINLTGTLNGIFFTSSGSGNTFLADNGVYKSIGDLSYLPLSAGNQNALSGTLYTLDIVPMDGNVQDIGTASSKYNNIYANNIYANINGVELLDTGDGNSYLSNDGTYKSVSATTSPYIHKTGSIVEADSSVNVEIGDSGLTLSTEYKDGSTGQVRLKGTSASVTANVYRTSVFNGTSEGQAFNATEFTTTGTLIDDTIYLAANDRININISVGGDFYEGVILVSENGADVQMSVVKFS